MIARAACSQANEVTFRAASNNPPAPTRLTTAPPSTSVVTPATHVALEFSGVRRVNPMAGFVGILRRSQQPVTVDHAATNKPAHFRIYSGTESIAATSDVYLKW